MTNYVGQHGTLTLAFMQGAPVKVIAQAPDTGVLTVELLADYNGTYKAGAHIQIAPYHFARKQGNPHGPHQD